MGAHDLVLSRPWRIACTVLQVVPVPGVGAIIAGWRNPHSGFLGRGVAQALLVLLGAWPLVFPAVLGLAWAAWDAVQIHRRARQPGLLSRPADAPPPGPKAPRRWRPRWRRRPATDAPARPDRLQRTRKRPGRAGRRGPDRQGRLG